MCTQMTYVAGTVRKLVHMKQILVRFYVAARTVCKSSAHDAKLKIEVILSLLHDSRIQTSWILRNMLRGENVFRQNVMLRGQTFVTTTERFRKNMHVKREKLSLQYVLATFPLVRACDHQYTLLTDILVGFSNGSVKVRFRVVVKVDKREDKEPAEIANKVGRTLKSNVETGQIGSLKVKPTVELRGLRCSIDVVHSFVG